MGTSVWLHSSAQEVASWVNAPLSADASQLNRPVNGLSPDKG